MKTKYAASFMVFGFLIGVSPFMNIAYAETGPAQTVANLFVLVLGICLLGYGRKLKLLGKKGIDDTKELAKGKARAT